ncbi:hypothetical protein C8R44DRAFT_788378 [Mycena epipterygia]|nr:hypothetical protein C8R44DRAFT_788378 [Mycena epipterygia]
MLLILPTLFFDASVGHWIPAPAPLAPLVWATTLSSGGVTSPIESSLDSSDDVDVDTLPRGPSVPLRDVLASRRRLEK